jgi:ABC-type lipoprotein export system ATPase subunit
MQSFVELNNIAVKIPGESKPLFKIKKLEVKKGEKILIRGRSGVGKTTLLHLIAGLLKPDKGKVEIDEIEINDLSDSEKSRFRRSNIGIIFQKLNLIDHLTARENILLGLKPGKSDDSKINERLLQMEIEDKANVLTSNLSLGEQQRVAVARILSFDYKLILADEPTSSLDDLNADHVIKGLSSVEKNSTLIVVSHDHRIEKRFERIIDFNDFNKAA